MRWLLLAAVCGALGCAGPLQWIRTQTATLGPKPAATKARVLGRISAGDGAAALGRAAVFLERIDGGVGDVPPPAVVIRQEFARFDPEFAVTAVGQPVLFTNQDTIFHGVFSYSRPNEFERPPFPPGHTRAVIFKHAGVVRTYSPLHTDMRGVILVVPGAWHAVPDTEGGFAIEGIPSGRYRLSLWTERSGETTREISLAAGQAARVHLELGSGTERAR
jgi:plastocyanin